jgi:hypothetical protein
MHGRDAILPTRSVRALGPRGHGAREPGASCKNGGAPLPTLRVTLCHPRPTKGIKFAITVMNNTLVSSGSEAM